MIENRRAGRKQCKYWKTGKVEHVFTNDTVIFVVKGELSSKAREEKYLETDNGRVGQK